MDLLTIAGRCFWIRRNLVLFFSGSAILVSLSAYAQESERAADGSRHLRQRIAGLASQLETNGDPEIRKLKVALETDVGLLVVRDHVGWIQERLRGRARDEAIPIYLDRYFSADGQVRDRDFAERFVNKTQEYTSDISRIAAHLKAVATKVTATTEEDRFLKRFLQHESAAAMIYFRHLRKTLRPDATAIGERLGEIFVRIGNEYQVRAGTRDEAEHIAKQMARAMKSYDLIRDDLLDYAKEIADRPGLTNEFKKALQDPTFTTMIAFEIAEDHDAPLGPRIDELFEQLEWILVDASDGLVVRKEAEPEARERLVQVERISASATSLRDAISQFSDLVSEQDDLHRQLKTFLQSDLAPVRIGEDYELSSASPEEAVSAMISEAVVTNPDGSRQLRDESKGEFAEQARDIMREFRMLKRKSKSIHRFAEQVTQSDVAAALKSTAGKLVIAAAIRQEYSGQRFDGVSRWIEEHFEVIPEGYSLRDGHGGFVKEFLQQVRDVENELGKDDF